jgi:LmbE family N-acetylglucosaminyl deacetylase
VRIICIGAHPDDCEIGFGGTAAKVAAGGHAVKFLSVTDGSAGHHLHSREETADLRKQEAIEAATRLGIEETQVLSHRDGELAPRLETRQEIVRQIRLWEADVVLTHRPWDYHPDHRYTSQLVQDSAYLVMVPHVCPETPSVRTNPVFLYLQDEFHLPSRFTPEIAVDIDEVLDLKIDAMDAHASQFYEWLPWVEGNLDQLPTGRTFRRQWLANRWSRPIDSCARASLARRYGVERAPQIQHAEFFQVCEYGRRPTREELEDIFPR